MDFEKALDNFECGSVYISNGSMSIFLLPINIQECGKYVPSLIIKTHIPLER